MKRWLTVGKGHGCPITYGSAGKGVVIDLEADHGVIDQVEATDPIAPADRITDGKKKTSVWC